MEGYTLHLSEKEIEQTNEQISNSPAVRDKLQILLNNVGDLHCVFCPKHRIEFNTKFYNDAGNAKILIDFALNEYASVLFDKDTNALMEKLDNGDKQDILTGEIEKIQKRMDFAKPSPEDEKRYGPSKLLQGYSDKRTLSYPEAWIQRNICNDDRYVKEYAEGAALYQYEKFVQKMISEDGVSGEINGNINRSDARKKLLLMREFGLLEIMVEKYSQSRRGQLNDKELSRLISLMIGEDAGTIYKELMAIHHNVKGSKDRPINPSSVNKVKELLASFGLDITNLPVIKDKIKDR